MIISLNNSNEEVLTNYQVINPKSKNCILLLHGFGGNLSAWNNVISSIENKKIILIDLRGHGKSSRSKLANFYQIPNFVTDITKILNNEKVNNCHIVGHCFGGMIALEFSKKYPNMVDKLILINSADSLRNIIKKIPKPKLLQLFFRILSKAIPNIGLSGYSDFGKYVNTTDYNPRRLISDIAHTHLHAYFSILANIIAYDFSISSSDILPETYIVQGSKDKVIPNYLTKTLKKKIKKSKLITINSGHISPITHPNKIGNIIKKILN